MNIAKGERRGRDVTEIFESLADRHRRATLRLLDDVDEPLTVDELATELAARFEHDGDDAGRQHGDVLRIRLHHCHLPKLEDAGLIRYDAERKQVSLAEPVPNRDVVEAGLAVVAEAA